MFNSQFIIYWSIVSSTVLAFIHIAFSVAVYEDAKKQTDYEPTGSVFVGPFFWAISVLVGGVLVAGIYWLIHHSNLKKTVNYT